eukprot:Unigene2082_Nuclearia_a/m.6466 Unigene2082_Nuclearia_a/g.6466  ORF Unigene2082_Nuclearia_a/g.6466 Unigene2082_Nuclearia_a/m.6466 type:complete len:500 (+) Unigene2082_Nuclearia_a:51-1550(+)
MARLTWSLLALALALLVAAAAPTRALPVFEELRGPVVGNGYVSLVLPVPANAAAYNAVYKGGITVKLEASPTNCLSACVTDLLRAYPDMGSWTRAGVCRAYLPSDGQTTVALRPGFAHITLHNPQTTQCLYTVTYSGELCDASDAYGPDCEPRTAKPAGQVTLQPGQVLTFEGVYSTASRVPRYAFAKIQVEPLADGGNATVGNNNVTIAARAYDHPRFDYEAFDNKTQVTVPAAGGVAVQVDVELTTPPRTFNIATVKIPLFFSVYADPANTASVTFSVVSVGEVDCAIEYYGGRDCNIFTPITPDSNTYNLSSTYTPNPIVDTLDRLDFSVGMQTLYGQMVAYLRFGNVPVPSANLFDVFIPMSAASGTGTTDVRFYASGLGVNLNDTAIYVAFYSADERPDDQYLYWMNHNCPNRDCGGNGICTSNRCLCNEGFPAPTCSSDGLDNPTLLPPAAGGRSSSENFLIALGVLGAVGLVALWGYLHYRRKSVTGSYNNL